MSDPTETTGQSTGTQSSSQGQATQTTSLEGYVEKARLDGALVKIQELTLANRALAEANTANQTKIADLTATLTQKEADNAALVGQHKTALEEIKGKFDTTSQELQKASARNLKLEAIKASGHAELISIIDDLPAAENAEAQLQIVNNMAKFAEGLVKKRESELLAGNTDSSTGMGTSLTPNMPSTEEGWQKYVQTFPVGSKERTAAFDEYFVWTTKPKT
jgi:hypothetical protein